MKSSAKKQQHKTKKSKHTPMPLAKVNYLFIGIGVFVIAFSYTAMYLENSADGFFSLYVSPVLLVAAYAWILFALLYRKKT